MVKIKETSVELYQKMLRIRMIEEAIAEKYPEQKMRCPVHLSIGQEAVAVGVLQHIKKTDYLISNHRAHAHYLAKGGSLKNMLAEIYGKATGCSSGMGGSMHLIDFEANIVGTTPIVGGSLPVGVGVAFACFLKKEEAITVIFFGEGATEEGVWSECLNFAALKQLPILFVCENNFYSVYSPLDVRQPKERDRVALAKAHGIAGFSGHGNDVEEVFKIAEKAINYVREKKVPCFVEFDTYRYREHCGPFVDNEGYRPKEEISYWYDRCPIKNQENYLQTQGITVDIATLREEIESEIEDAFTFAQNAAFPKKTPPVYAP